jgi:CubicO group peptidase (beta-lactamase class C family)
VKPVLLALLLSLAGGCGGGGGGSSPAAGGAPLPSTGGGQTGTMEGALDDGVAAGIDGLILQVEKSGAVTTAVAGVRSRVGPAPMEADALFKIASISKLFIAVAVTKLAVQGSLSVDDTLAQHLPELQGRIPYADVITLRQIVRHRSGIADFDSQPGFRWEDPHTDIDTTLAYALDKPADFAPNARYEYSNTNYLLLGKVLDRVLGYSHRVYIQDFVLSPLGMLDTFHQLSEAPADRLVRGYWDGVDRTTLDYASPGGSMVSTAADVAVFLRALATGELFDEEERSLYNNLYWTSHSGWLPGYQSIANYESSLGAVVVLFANTTGGNSEDALNRTYQRVLDRLR